MKRTTVRLKDLKPNPYKKDICGGHIDEYVVSQIKESASKTSFWEQWVVREKDGEYQMAFGHHRLAAALELYGPEYEVSVQVEPYTDEQMLIALADENAGGEESVEAQVDVIRIARNHLRKHPEACKQQVSGNRTAVKKHGHEQECQHGSVRCLLAFLGEKNWSKTKVADLAVIADGLDIDLLREETTYQADRSDKIGFTAAAEIAKLEKQAQKPVVAAIKRANKELSAFKDKEVKVRRKKSLPYGGVKKMCTHIPSSVVRHVVKEAEGLPPAKQAQAVIDQINHNVALRKKHAIDESLPWAEGAASTVIDQLYKFPDADMMEELIRNREHIHPTTGTRLMTAIGKHMKRLQGYLDDLMSPQAKKLKA